MTLNCSVQRPPAWEEGIRVQLQTLSDHQQITKGEYENIINLHTKNPRAAEEIILDLYFERFTRKQDFYVPYDYLRVIEKIQGLRDEIRKKGALPDFITLDELLLSSTHGL